MAELDLSTLQAEVDALSPDQLRQAVLDAKVRQKVQMKKYHNPEKAKAYREKRAAILKIAVERAKAAGIYDQIMAEADDLADQKIAESEEAA